MGKGDERGGTGGMAVKVLGIDLALRAVGWALVDDDGECLGWDEFTTPAVRKGDAAGRMARWAKLECELHALPWREADAVVVEYASRWPRAKRGTSTATLEAVMGAKAVLELVAWDEGATPPEYVDPNEWQRSSLSRSVLDTKRASVLVAEDAVGVPMGEHEADAYNMAVWWLKVGRWERDGMESDT